MPSTTLMAVSSSIAYAGPDKSSSPPLCGGHRVQRQVRVVEVREDREVDDPQGAVVCRGRPRHEIVTDPGGHHHAAGAHPNPDQLGQRRQEVRQSALPQPVAQVRRIAALDEQDVRLSDQRDPALRVEARQGGELQHSHGLPAQSDRGSAGLLPADAQPRLARAGQGMPVQRRGNAEGVALGGRLAEQLDQRVVDARVLDAGGSEKKFQSACSFARVLARSLKRLRRGAQFIGRAGRSPGEGDEVRRGQQRHHVEPHVAGGDAARRVAVGDAEPRQLRAQRQVPIAVPYSSSDADDEEHPA